MKQAFWGVVEVVVLLTVVIPDDAAYGVTVTQKMGRTVGFRTVNTTLQRPIKKGYLTSTVGGAMTGRGSQRKRF